MRKLSPTRKALYIISGIAILLLIALIAVACKPTQNKEYNTAQGEAKLIRIGSGYVGRYHYVIAYDADTKVEYIITDNYIMPRERAYGGYVFYTEK